MRQKPYVQHSAAPSARKSALADSLGLFGRIATTALGVVAAIAAAIGLGQSVTAAPDGTRFSPEYFTNVEVTTHEGKTLRFYDDLIKGKRVVINFVYLSCTDICPLSTSRMAQIRQRLGDEVGRDVFIYTITMDPERDTPDVMKSYADAFGGGNGWLFITGKPEDLAMIRYRLGDRSRKLSEHRNDLVLGNDVTGDWSRSSIYNDFDVTVTNIRELDPVYFGTKKTLPVSAAPEEAQLRLDGHPGQALFVKACSTCHTIGGGTLIGPDIKDVGKHRDRAWLLRFLMSPDKMRAEKDPIVMEMAAKFPSVLMPNLGLMENDAADLLQYIEARSAARDAKAQAAHPQTGGGG